MGVKRLYGNDGAGILGMNTKAAAHLLGAQELQVATNCDFSRAGAASNLDGDAAVTTAASVNGIGTASVGGVVYYFYLTTGLSPDVMAFNTETEAVSQVGGALYSGWFVGGGPLRVVQGNDVAILTDGTVANIWDGTNLYGFSAPTPTRSLLGGDYIVLSRPTEVAITGISVSGTTVTVSTGAIAINVGDKVWIDGVTSAYTEINDRLYEVTAEDGTDIDFEALDAGDWTTGTPSGGTIYVGACGLDGLYTYRASTVVDLPSGETVEGSLGVVKQFYGSERIEQIDISPTDVVKVYLSGFNNSDLTGWISGTYTPGTDLDVKRRVYRSKVGDTSQAYLLAESDHSDVYGGPYTWLYYDSTQDADLGAVWLPATFDAHDAPPSFSAACTHAQRLYVASGNRVHFSGLDGHNYFAPLDYLEMDEAVTALASVGDFVAIFADHAAWLYDPFNVSVKNLKVRYGVSSQEAVEAFDGRVWFANDLGLFVLDSAQLGGFSVDAVQSSSASEKIDANWRAAGPGDWALASTHDTLYAICSNGTTSEAFALQMPEGNWSTLETADDAYAYVISDVKNNVCVYAGLDKILRKVGGSALSPKTMTVKGGKYVGKRAKLSAIMLDVIPAGGMIVTVTSAAGDSAQAALTASATRKRAVLPLDGVTGDIFDVQIVGIGTVYGWTLQVDELVETFF